MIALFIGRFQPFHLGHLDALQQIAKKYDTIKVGIGSSNESGTDKNPYDFETRVQMINSCSLEIPANLEFYPLPDFGNDDKWLKNTLEVVGDFDTVFTGNPHVNKLFEEKCFKTKTQIFNFDICGSDIRTLIKKKEKYSFLIPSSVYQIIKTLA